MADNTPVPFDTSKLLETVQKDKSTGEDSMSYSSRGAADPVALAEIAKNMMDVGTLEAAKRASLAKTDEALNTARAKNFEQLSGATLDAVGAQSRTTAASTTATIQDEQAAQQLRQRAGLDINDPASKVNVLMKIIGDKTMSAIANTEQARAQEDKTVGSMLRGNTTFSEWYDAKFSHPASGFQEHAAADMETAKIASTGLGELQQVYSGAVAVNKSPAQLLNDSAVADAVQLKTQQMIKESSDAKELQLATGARGVEMALSRSQHAEGTAISMAGTLTSIENAKRMSESMGLKNKSPEEMAYYVRVGSKAMGNKAGSIMTPKLLQEVMNNPAQKALYDKIAEAGAGLVAHGITTPQDPLPPVFGSAGEVQELLDNSQGAKMPPGSEQFQLKLGVLSIGADKDMAGNLVKPSQRIANINTKVAAYVDDIQQDTDNSAYGKPHLPTLVSMPSMNAPDVKDFTDTVLKPAALKNETLDGAVLVEMARQSNLTPNQLAKGFKRFADSTAALVNSTRHPQLLGFPAASGKTYTVLTKGDGIFSKVERLNLGDEAAVNKYFFRKGMQKKQLEDVSKGVQ